MNEIERGWTGASWRILPFESSFSVCTRFAWLNALSRVQLHRLGLLARLHGARTFLAHEMRMATNLQNVLRPSLLPLTEHALFESNAIGLFSSLFSRTLRICPLCLEAGYHAFWHQCKPLCVCPAHGVELIAHCMACDAPLPSFGDLALYERPYTCTGCGHPYCGAEFSIDAHLDFRQHVNLLADRFAEIAQWFSRLDGILDWAFFKNNESERYWAARWHLAYDFCGSILTPPADCMRVEDRGIVMRHWASESGWQSYHAQGFVNRRESDRIQSMYRSTLQLLKNWLHNRAVAWMGASASRGTLWVGGEGEIELQGDTLELAYLLLRWVLSDDPFARNVRKVTDAIDRVSPGPVLGWFAPSFDMPRTALRMVLLWLYTKMVEFLIAHQGQRVISFWEIQDFLIACDAPVLLGNTQHVHQGIVIFRAFSGMPLSTSQLTA